MPDCPSLLKCPFFNDTMTTKPATADIIKKSYCRGDNSQCARWMVASALGKEAVPSNLYPSQADQARELLKRK